MILEYVSLTRKWSSFYKLLYQTRLMLERSSGIHTGDNIVSVREATSFLPFMLTTLLCMCCTVVIPDSSALNILWTG